MRRGPSFFFFFFFLLLKAMKFVLGLPKWEFSTGKLSISHREKHQENDFAPSEKYSSYARPWPSTSLQRETLGLSTHVSGFFFFGGGVKLGPVFTDVCVTSSPPIWAAHPRISYICEVPPKPPLALVLGALAQIILISSIYGMHRYDRYENFATKL